MRTKILSMLLCLCTLSSFAQSSENNYQVSSVNAEIPKGSTCCLVAMNVILPDFILLEMYQEVFKRGLLNGINYYDTKPQQCEYVNPITKLTYRLCYMFSFFESFSSNADVVLMIVETTLKKYKVDYFVIKSNV